MPLLFKNEVSREEEWKQLEETSLIKMQECFTLCTDNVEGLFPCKKGKKGSTFQNYPVYSSNSRLRKKRNDFVFVGSTDLTCSFQEIHQFFNALPAEKFRKNMFLIFGNNFVDGGIIASQEETKKKSDSDSMPNEVCSIRWFTYGKHSSKYITSSKAKYSFCMVNKTKIFQVSNNKKGSLATPTLILSMFPYIGLNKSEFNNQMNRPDTVAAALEFGLIAEDVGSNNIRLSCVCKNSDIKPYHVRNVIANDLSSIAESLVNQTLDSIEQAIQTLRLSQNYFVNRSDWVKDEDRCSCSVCLNIFHRLTRRKHHCRMCGEIICSSCSSLQPVYLNIVGLTKTRICLICAVKKDFINNVEKDTSDDVDGEIVTRHTLPNVTMKQESNKPRSFIDTKVRSTYHPPRSRRSIFTNTNSCITTSDSASYETIENIMQQSVDHREICENLLLSMSPTVMASEDAFCEEVKRQTSVSCAPKSLPSYNNIPHSIALQLPSIPSPSPIFGQQFEEERLSCLRNLSNQQPDLFNTAALFAKCEIALNSLNGCCAFFATIGRTHVVFEQTIGFDTIQLPREESLCDYAITVNNSKGVFHIPDCMRLEILRTNLMVQRNNIRFFAGVPINVNGYPIGCICVYTTKPKKAPATQDTSILTQLANMIEKDCEDLLSELDEKIN